MIRLKPLAASIAIPLVIGGLSSLLIQSSFGQYQSLIKPAFAPPAAVFPVVWTLLYILMGISAYMIYEHRSPLKRGALRIYALQLAANFIWPIIFFGMKSYVLSFLWIMLLWFLINIMIYTFYKINATAALLQLPYLLWVSFASILNLSIALLNK